MRSEDPQLARALSDDPPTRPREYRRWPAWCPLAVAVAVLVAGVAMGQGLPIAAGLVLAGIAAGHLFDPLPP